MKNPKVIKPPDFDIDKAWEECRDWTEQHRGSPIAEAAGADPGCCSCPKCKTYFWSFGLVQQCTECNFIFPTNWWSQYSKGCREGLQVNAGAEITGGMKHRTKDPYYCQGFYNPTKNAFEEKDKLDWEAIVGPQQKYHQSNDMSICERCGKKKEGRRKRSSQLCLKCESETECKHRTSLMDECCKAGVNYKELAGVEPGMIKRLPCFFYPGKIQSEVVECPMRQLITIEELKKEDEAVEKRMQEFMICIPLIDEIKKKYKGRNVRGCVDCPVCGGKLNFSHAAINGHVHGKCETENCISWME